MDSGFTVMDRVGIDPRYAAGRASWTTIKCASKRAYGCGDLGDSAVQDLDLLLNHGDLDNLSSSLSVRAGDEVFRWIDQVIAAKEGSRPVYGEKKKRYLRSKVETVDKGLIVVSLYFSLSSGFNYYLVFDSVDRSLSMVPHIPRWATSYKKCPLPLRHHGGGGGGYTLVLFGGEFRFGPERPNKYLWRWSPVPGSSDAWQSKKLRFPSEIKNKFFSPDVLFSSNGRAFWTDLAMGTLSCKCSTLLSQEGYLVKFTFIHLPPGCQLERDEDKWPVEVYRTMGCAGGSVKFVVVDGPHDPSDGLGRRVKVWTLAPSAGFKWKLCSDVQLKKLRKDFKRAGLPKTLPMWPMLSEQQGDALYLIMAGESYTSDGGRNLHICKLDMPTKSRVHSQLLAHKSLLLGPLMLPSAFFKYIDPLPSSPGPILLEV